VTEELGFTTEFLSMASTLMWGVMLVGTVAAKKCFGDGSSYAKAFWWGQLASAACNIFTIALVLRWNVLVGIPDKAFVLVTDSVETVLSRIMMLPFLTMAAKLTPAGVRRRIIAQGAGFFFFSSKNEILY